MAKPGDLRKKDGLLQVAVPSVGATFLMGSAAMGVGTWTFYPPEGLNWLFGDGKRRFMSLADANYAYQQGARTMRRALQLLALEDAPGREAPVSRAGAVPARGPVVPGVEGKGAGAGSRVSGTVGRDAWYEPGGSDGWGAVSGFGLGDGDQENDNYFWPRPGEEAFHQALYKLAMSQDALLAKNAAAVPVQGDTKQLNAAGYAIDKLAAVCRAAYVAPGTTQGRGEYLAALLVTGAVGNKFDVVGGPVVNGTASWDSSDNATALATVTGSKVSTYVVGAGGAYLLRLPRPVQVGDGTESQLAIRLYTTGMSVTGEFYASLDAARQYGPKLQLMGNGG